MDPKNEINFPATQEIERALIDDVLSGNYGAFGQIIKGTEGLVTQVIFKLVNDPEDRKDIAQDIYLKAFKNLKGFKFRSKLSTWIGHIAYNTCINYLEKKKLVLIDEHDGDEPGDVLMMMNVNPGLHDETEGVLSQKQLSNILKREIEKLSPIYKTLITLYHNEELSYSEISDITGLPDGTVKNYLFRARKLLKNNLLLNYKKEDL